jgi:transglutaminase-like putative cysteine protease
MRRSMARILPMYAAACAVLLCGLGAYVSTYEGFGGGAVLVVLVGVCVSVFARLRRLRQDTMFGLLAAIVVVLIFWVSATGGGASLSALGILGDRNNFPGVLLAWFVMLYSFAMITDEVIIFSIVPSIALLGTMASDNLNADIVVYFMGLVLSAVFLLVYENMLSRGVFDAAAAPREPAPSGAGGVRTSLLMTSVVVALALVVGFVASRPLTTLGQTLREHAPDMPMSPTSQFSSDVTAKYINEMVLSGQPPRLSDRVVMRVHTPRPFYWRGKVFSAYTGFSWTGSDAPAPQRLDRALFAMRPLAGDPAQGEMKARVPVIQNIEVADSTLGGPLVAASEAQRVRFHPFARERRDGERPRVYGSDRGMATRSGNRWKDYSVLSRVSVATPEQLRKAGTVFPLALKITNTTLNGDPSPERRLIAERVTAGAKTEYDKVKALEEYLQTNFAYTLTPPRTPSSVDAVTYFLTQTKEGYCEIFASSMAVLCRELGIPARLATGFAPGEWTPEGSANSRDYTYGLNLTADTARAATAAGPYGTSIVRERDLHAWTEVYFPGYGWIAFDPTSSREAAPAWGSSFADAVRNLAAQVAAAATGPALVLLAMAIAALFLVKSYGWDTVRASTWWKATALGRRKSLPPKARWDWLYARSHRRLKRRAGAKRLQQTPYEYAEQARAALVPEAAAAFDALTQHYVRHAFQRRDPTEDDIAALLALDAALKKALRIRGPASVAAAQPSVP